MLKEGIVEDSVNKEKLSKLLRYESSQTENGEMTNLKDYVRYGRRSGCHLFSYSGLDCQRERALI